jgi:hypothetical protein
MEHTNVSLLSFDEKVEVLGKFIVEIQKKGIKTWTFLLIQKEGSVETLHEVIKQVKFKNPVQKCILLHTIEFIKLQQERSKYGITDEEWNYICSTLDTLNDVIKVTFEDVLKLAEEGG